jgi:hypothetical protein
MLCDCCRYNEVIPDLTIDGNRERWAALKGVMNGGGEHRLDVEVDVMPQAG